MKLKSLNNLLNKMNIAPSPGFENIMVRDITYDSRKVKQESLFIAIKGFQVDGHTFLEKAEKQGAVAAIVEEKNPEVKMPQIIVENSRYAMSQLAKEFYAPELSQIRTVGITGTNGKTSTTYLTRGVLESAGLSSGLIGTIEYDIGGEKISSWNTTPESTDLLSMMYSMHLKGQKGCVMEVSSHGLALNRVDGIDFEAAVFTNLSHDHLDFHSDIEDYFNAKKRLFHLLKPQGVAVINIEDEYGQRLVNELNQENITFGLNPKAMVYAKNWISDFNGLSINITTPVGDFHIDSPLIGQFNVENILASIGVGLAFQFDLKTIKSGIESVNRIPGRLEPVKLKNNRMAVIDYSHTPAALQKALIELNKINNNNLWVVFGCGGDRDKTKRPVMGKIAEDYATKVVVTSDNPRTENADEIIEDIMQGIVIEENVTVLADRKEAMAYAVKNAEPKDIILIAGKGHETYQEINGIKHPFNDRLIIEELDK